MTLKGKIWNRIFFFFKEDSISTTTNNVEPSLSGAFKWTTGWDNLGKSLEIWKDPPSQEREILICQFTHGLTSFRKDAREGTTEVLRMTALTSLS